MTEKEIDCSVLRVGLSWDLFEGCVKTDLDCAALVFDSNTTLVDACYYNQTSIVHGCIKCGGDERDGTKEGFDEAITVDLARLPKDIHVIVLIVNAYQGGTLADVETARATFQQEGKGDVCGMGLHCGRSSNSCGTIVALLYRKNELWVLKESGLPASGRTFQESYKDVLSALATVVDPVLLAERRANMNKTFNMQKNDICELPSDLFVSGEDLFVGLGWDTPCDLDSGIVITDRDAKEGAKMINIVNYSDKTFGRAVIHNGDNRSGAGGGDDEKIDIDLDYMPEEVGALYVVVNIFTSGYTFAQVRGAYIRLVAARNGHVLCKFALTQGSVTQRGLVLAKISRNAAGRWCVTAVGEGCDGQTAREAPTQKACGITGQGLTPQQIQFIESKASEMNCSCTILRLCLQGVKLAAKDGFLMGGKSDPFFEVWDVTESLHVLVARSNTIMKTLDPVWNELVTEVESGHKYRILVCDYDRGMRNDLIGHLDLGDLETFAARLGGGEQKKTHKLTPPPPPHQQEAGEILVVAAQVSTVKCTEGILRARKTRSSAAWINSSGPLDTI